MTKRKNSKHVTKGLPHGEKESSVVSQIDGQMQRVRERLSGIKHKIAVLSGKGGVGKSIVTANLASALARQGNQVGILDADINGPSIPTMLGAGRFTYASTPDGVVPAIGYDGIRIASMGLLLEASRPVHWKAPGQPPHAVWEGAMEMSVIREFLADFAWGELDFLLIDLPPGTGDKPALLTRLIPDIDGALVVTISSKVCRQIVEKSIHFCAHVGLPVLGLVENMSHIVCTDCGREMDLFGKIDRGEGADPGLAPAVSVPFDPRLSVAADEGRSFLDEYPDGAASAAFYELARKLPDLLRWRSEYMTKI